MEITNRLTKSLSKNITSKDELRPQMQGILADGPNMLATDGHQLVIVEGGDENEHFADPAIYRIDEKQAMNAEFIAEVHEYITDGEYPRAEGILPEGEEYVHHEFKLQVSVLESLLKFLKSIGSSAIQLKVPENRNKAILWETNLPTHKDVDIKRVCGLIMPMMINDDIPTGNPFNDATVKMVKDMVDNANAFTNELATEEV